MFSSNRFTLLANRAISSTRSIQSFLVGYGPRVSLNSTHSWGAAAKHISKTASNIKFSREHVAHPCIMGGFGTAVNPVFYMVYLKITKKVKRGLTNRKNDATIGPSPAGVNPISPRSPQRFAKLPLLVRPAGVFSLGGWGSPRGSQINHIDNLKSRKNMSGLHSKCRGGGVTLAYPRTSHIFILFVNLADTLTPRT